MTRHSKTGGSSAERWLNCPGSVTLANEAEPEQETEEPDYRADGIIAHRIAALCLTENQEAWEHAASEPRFTGEQVEAVQQYINFVLNRIEDLRASFSKVDVFVEQHVSDPDQTEFYGTVDAYLLCYRGKVAVYCEVIDYKHGVGISVDAEDNPQLKYYARGVQIRHPMVAKFKLIIVQPRGFHWQGPIREWEISGRDLAIWAETVLNPGIKLAHSGEGEFVPGPHCRFCPFKLACPALGAVAKAAATAGKSSVGVLSDEALGREFALTKALATYTKAVYDEVSRRAFAGKKGAWKIVYKKSDRVWVDGYQAPRMSVPMSPAQAEIRMENGKELTEKFATKPKNPGYTVVGPEDKRPAQTRTATDFEGIDNPE